MNDLVPGLSSTLSLKAERPPAAALAPDVSAFAGLPPAFATTFTACFVE